MLRDFQYELDEYSAAWNIVAQLPGSGVFRVSKVSTRLQKLGNAYTSTLPQAYRG